MRKSALLLIGCAALCGCVHALKPYNQPSEQKLTIQATNLQEVVVQVGEGAGTPVPGDGRLVLNVPPLERGCATYLFGVVKVKESSAYDVPVIQVRRGEHTIRKFSINDLSKLPVDKQGYRLVRVE